ncbi:uncharacterized protein LOC114939418 [Nylanderia fulva]|uniref:uncharacterized protein LOC114939418 n=1 Tax=Nylanderia fulva TaxID=613905 RepID=UPI0010FAED1E|nr:uncharacterized protein LOC114939418 [Nylanderia fulva]
MATSNSESNTWVLDYCTIENNKVKCDICSWKHNLIKQQLNQIKAHITSKHKKIYRSISSSSVISFRSYESTQVYTIKNYDVYCKFCDEIYFGENKAFSNIQTHITKTHKVEINTAKDIYNWLQPHFYENNINAKSCCCYYCNNDIPNKPVFLMFHLIQVHAAKIPEAIRPTKFWNSIANNKKWMCKFVTTYLITEGEERTNCNICDKRLSINVDYENITTHIYDKHRTVHEKRISVQAVLQEKNIFSIENYQIKCNKCKYTCPIRYIDRNNELENHFSNEHKLDYAQINNFVNWLKLYRNVIYFQTLECNACKNIFNDNYFSLMRHFIEEHPIKFLLHLISEK